MLIQARDQASKKFAKVGKAGLSMGGMLKRAAGLAGAYFGAKAAIGFGKDSLAAFAKQETAVNHLQSALGNLGAGSQLAEMKNFAASLQEVTTVGDETTMELMALGASMGGMTGPQLQAATQAAIGFSKSLGIDTKAAMTLVSKAAQGNTSSFTRYGIQLDESMSQQEKFQAILAKGAEGFKVAQGETDTMAGRMQQLSNTWGDFKETVGGALAGVMPAIKDSFVKLQVVIENWSLVMDTTWASAKFGLISFWEDIKHFFGSTIPTLLSWFGDHWKEVFTDYWNFTKTIWTNMFINAKNFFVALYSWLSGDGIDFEWTGLTEGFKSAITEMPEIAKREMTGVEKELALKIVANDMKFNEKLAAKMKNDYDPGAIVAAAVGTGGGSGGGKSTMANKIGGGGQQLAAKESRFLALGRTTADKQLAEQKTTNKLLAKYLSQGAKTQNETFVNNILGMETLGMA